MARKTPSRQFARATGTGCGNSFFDSFQRLLGKR